MSNGTLHWVNNTESGLGSIVSRPTQDLVRAMGGAISGAATDEFVTVPGMSNTVDAANFGDPADANEIKITAAIAYAVLHGKAYCLIRRALMPYNAALVTRDPAVQLLREAGPGADVFDVQAYGGRNDGVDGWAGEQAAYDAASAGTTGRYVYYGPGRFVVSKPVSAFKVNVNGRSAYRGDDYAGSTYILGSYSGGPRLILQDRTSSLPLVASLATGPGNAITASGGYYNLRDCRQGDLNGLTAFSVCCFYQGTGAGPGCFVSSRGKMLNNDAIGNAFSLYAQNPGALFTLKTTTSGTVTISGGTVNDSAIHWIEGSWDGTTMRLFVDGTSVATAACSGTLVQEFGEAVTVGLDFEFPESTSHVGSPNGKLDGIWLSDIARNTANYAKPTAKPTNDSHTLFLINHDEQQGQATRAQSKDGNLWLVFRSATGPEGGARFAIDNITFDGSGVLNAIHVVPPTYDPSLTRLDGLNLRSGILAPTGNFYNARYRDLKFLGGAYGRFGFWGSSTTGLADMTSIWTQGFRYHALNPGFSIRNWFMQMDSMTVIGMVLQNQASAGVPWSVDTLTGNTEPGVSSDYRAALAFGGFGLRVSGVRASNSTFETGNNAPFLIADDVDSAKFSLCNFIRQGSPTSVMVARGTFRQPVVFENCEQGNDIAGFLPWSDTAGTATAITAGRKTLTFSTTPTFDFNKAEQWTLDQLTDNVTAQTWQNAGDGQPIVVRYQQNASAAKTVAAPSNVIGWTAISATLGSISEFRGSYDQSLGKFVGSMFAGLT